MLYRVLLAITLSVAMTGVASAATKKLTSNSQKNSAVQKSEVHTNHSSGLGGKLEVEPYFGMAFIGPKDLNDLIRDNNDAFQQKFGLKNFSASNLGTSTNYGISTVYRVTPMIGLGLGFNRVGASSEASSTQNNVTARAEYEASASMLTAESRITLTRFASDAAEIYAAPFFGIGWYSAAQRFSGNAIGNSIEVNSSSTGMVFGSTAGTRYWFNPSVAAGLVTGYRFAKSGNLKVDSQKNSDVGVGSEAENGGKKLQLDMSSFVLGAQLTWAI